MFIKYNMTEYYNKYLKYKKKYLNLKNNDMIGGSKKVNNNITLRNVTKDNFNNIIELNSGKDNIYITTNAYTIIESFFDKKIKYVKGIYLNNIPIGLIWSFPKSKNELYISRFMIDKKYQGKGYGKISFNLSLKYFVNKYKPTKLVISSKNEVAINLYKKFGFKDTGKIDVKYGDKILEVLTKNIIYL